jgi:predicted site-specific integrase-resolvase
MSVTIDEAADFAGVSVALLRKWVLAGDLEPVRRGARPLRFHYDDVARVQASKRTKAWRTRHAEAVAAWDACVSSDS